MRSESKRRERRMKRNSIIIGIVFIFLMVFSMLAVMVTNPDNSTVLSYNGYDFSVRDVDGGQMVVTKVNNQEYSFYTMPEDAIRMVGNISGVDVIATSNTLIFAKEPLGIGSTASTEQLYYNVLIYDLRVSSGKSIVSGLSEEEEYSNEKVYTCNDATQNSPVIMMKKGTYTTMNITEIQPNCFELRSDGLNVLMLRDYVLYKSLGIIA